MIEIVGIRYKRSGKIYDFDASGYELNINDKVVVESDFGLSIGTVVKTKTIIEAYDRPLKKIIRMATEEDFKVIEDNKKLEREAYTFCLERIQARGMQMKLICTEATIDRKRIIFYFTADGRIDFRELVKDLAAQFRTRIEMRQIGVRDSAKMLGGIGLCGREFCCSSFLSSFEPVAIKMAKDQELVLNVAKLSGVCGRLMCCLRYEFDGDIKEIPLEDEVVPIELDIPNDIKDEPITAILSSINKELPEEDDNENNKEDLSCKQDEIDMETTDEINEIEINEVKNKESRDKKIEKRHFKKRRHHRI
ncbi:MAG TPA: hypothetical protein HPP56_01950 [Nitrospirae bacterium]|nr:hypothetical protein [Nitrospirota bacterium]